MIGADKWNDEHGSFDTDGAQDTVDDDGDGYSEADGDCDDSNAAINPGATDVVGDDTDQNCDDVDGTDGDGDGYASEASGGMVSGTPAPPGK